MTSIRHQHVAWSRRDGWALPRAGWTALMGQLPRVSWLPGAIAVAIAGLTLPQAAWLLLADPTSTLAQVGTVAALGAGLAVVALATRAPARLPAWAALTGLCAGTGGMAAWGLLASGVPGGVWTQLAELVLALALLWASTRLGPDQS